MGGLRVGRCEPPVGQAAYQYNLLRQVLTVTLPNGVASAYELDAAGNRT